jgi:hypothetical protein
MFEASSSHLQNPLVPRIVAPLRRVRATIAAAPPLAPYAVSAGIGAACVLLLARGVELAGPAVLLPLFPAVGVVAALAGRRFGVACGAAALVASWLLLPLGASLTLLLAVTLVPVAAIAGTFSDAFLAAHDAAEEQRVATTAYAATLHLRLTLAEQQLDRAQRREDAALEEGLRPDRG